MSFKILRKLPSTETVKSEIPLPKEAINIKNKRDTLISDIITGSSDKFLVIIGPCSADNEEAVIEYTYRLAKLQNMYEKKLVFIPRIYTSKPRTTGIGYKGMIHQVTPTVIPNISDGIIACRKLHIRSILETGLTAADEILYLENWSYFSDLISYATIGARSVENQAHRFLASGLDIPVRMKNPTSGNISIMLNSISAAQQKQDFAYQGHEVLTNGNFLAHAILRGGINKYNDYMPNYHYENLLELISLYDIYKVKNPAVIVDVNHSNSGKQFKEQIRIVKEILYTRQQDKKIYNIIKGVMVESYINEGNQTVNGEYIYGKSITDACIGWKDTESLISTIAENC